MKARYFCGSVQNILWELFSRIVITVLGDDSGDADSDAKKPREDGDEKEEAVPSKLGCVLHFKGCGAETSREDLKTLFGEHETIEWVDFERGDTQVYSFR